MTSLLGPVILGIVEGLTEFIPVSSTRHLILTERLIGYEGRQASILDVVIQVGAILAICWLYRARLWAVVTGLSSDPQARRFSRNVLIAFVPSVIVGALAHDFIKRVLFTPWVVVASLVVGGTAIIVIERWARRAAFATSAVETLAPSLALKVGLCQLLSLVPGVVRSASSDPNNKPRAESYIGKAPSIIRSRRASSFPIVSSAICWLQSVTFSWPVAQDNSSDPRPRWLM